MYVGIISIIIDVLMIRKDYQHQLSHIKQRRLQEQADRTADAIDDLRGMLTPIVNILPDILESLRRLEGRIM